MMKKAVIFYRFLPQYRADFYNKLHDELAKEGVELSLIYGKSIDGNSLKKDEIDLPWATYVQHKIFKIAGIDFIWQPYLKYAKGMDLVIVEQANKLIINYLLIFYRYFSKFKLAQWGHGRNMQINDKSFANSFKRRLITACDWWFPYTEGVKQYIIDNGFDGDKITVVQNAIDTVGLSKEYDAINESEVTALKQTLSIDSDNIGLYCGGIYAEKRVEFLIEACDNIRLQVPDFNMVIIGSGTDAFKFKEAQNTRAWLHYLGSKFGAARVPYFKMSSVFLMPGLVGLAILDCFATKTPMITTTYPFHSPEIEYLSNNENGIITANNMESYVAGVVSVLMDKTKLQRLVNGCEKARTIYNNENMVNNFKNGILKCVGLN
jgi:glycosyltransferase involved in cell wall biosynthesis